MDEQMDEFVTVGTGEGFFCNRNQLLSAYKEERLFTLEAQETRRARNDPIFTKSKFAFANGALRYPLPAFCVLEKKEKEDSPVICTYLWTAERARGRGFAKKLLKGLNVTQADRVLYDAVPFWKSCGVEILSVQPRMK